MARLEEKGMVDLPLALTLVAVIGIGGFVLYRVVSTNEISTDSGPTPDTSQSADQDHSEPASDTTEQDTSSSDEVTAPEGWTAYTNPDIGLTFHHPPEFEDKGADFPPHRQEFGSVVSLFDESTARGVSVYYWESLEDMTQNDGWDSNGAGPYADIESYLATTAKQVTSSTDIDGVTAIELSIGGLDVVYGLMFETNNGIVELQFSGAANKSLLNELQVELISTVQID